MSWITPKTDWISSDRYNYYDYNRMAENMLELLMLTERYLSGIRPIDMVLKTGYHDRLYAKEFNALVENLRLINDATFHLDIGEDKFYASNEKTPDYKEFNRIEHAQKELYERILIHIKNAPHLAFKLGVKPVGHRENEV